jgi:2-phospho-L-lactate guanylyltransferase (CobY/MobA/RfbA family)
LEADFVERQIHKNKRDVPRQLHKAMVLQSDAPMLKVKDIGEFVSKPLDRRDLRG